MILRKLIANNFRQLLGRNTVEFAPPGNHNVTVLLGENGAGKTTLLNAFVWCLQGKLELKNEGSILSFKALQDATIGQELSVEVSMVFETEDAVYTATRGGTYRKEDGGKTIPVKPIELRIDRVGKIDGGTSRLPDPKQFVREIMPQALSKFFFFRGEDMEALANSDAASVNALKQGVESFLDIELLDRARKHADDVRKEFNRELEDMSQGDAKELGEKISAVEKEIEDLNGQAAALLDECHNHESRKLEVERRLSEVEETRPFLEQKAVLEATIQELDAAEADKRKQVAAVLSRDGYLWFSDEVLRTPLDLALAAAQRGELPAKIKPAFVDDRIALGECICGRPIDGAAKLALTEWRKNKGLAGLDEEITTLRSRVTDLQGRRDTSWKELEAARASLAAISASNRGAHEKLSAVESELRGKDFGLDYIRDLQKQLNTISDELIAAKVAHVRAVDLISSKKVDLEKFQKDRSDKIKGLAEVERIDRRARAISNINGALEAMRKGWVETVQGYLDEKLKTSWDEIAALDRLVEFTPDFRLVIKERDGHGQWTAAAPSQANQRALALAFVATLVELARDIAGTEGKGRRPVFMGGKYPLVMDAPFATMDKYFKETLPPGLQKAVPQLVLISNFEQWEGEVADRFAAATGRRYVLELHCTAEDRSVDFLGDRVPFVVNEVDPSRDWTVVKEVRRS